MRPGCYLFIKCSLCYLRRKTSGEVYWWMVSGWIWWWWAQIERAFSQISCWVELTTYSPNENHMQTGQRMEVFPIRYSFQLPFLFAFASEGWFGVIGRTPCSCLVCSTIAVARPEHANLGRSAAWFWFGRLQIRLCSFGKFWVTVFYSIGPALFSSFYSILQMFRGSDSCFCCCCCVCWKLGPWGGPCLLLELLHHSPLNVFNT